MRRNAAISIVLAACWACLAAPLGKVEVSAGDYDRRDTPVWLELAGVTATEPLQLREQDGDGLVPAQVVPGDPRRLCWILSGHTPAGSKRVFILTKGEPLPSVVTLRNDEAKLTLSLRDRPVLGYQHALLPPPPGASDRFKRSGFVHPLWSPSGTILTRIHPPDHIHHFGLWGPWTKTEYEGQGIDFWNLNQGEGTVRFARFITQTEGAVSGGFEAAQDHVWLRAPEGERVVLRETLSVRVWDQGPQPAWLMDYTSTYRCATARPLRLPAYRYGGLGFRGPEDWHNGNSDHLSSKGKTRRDGDGTSARWCDVFGETAHGLEGLLFMSHPENQAHPEPMRIWPPNSNSGRGDVFFNFCPIRHTDWELIPGRDHVLRYRLYAHQGKVPAAEAERLWRDFAQPPVARFVPLN